MTEFNYEFDLDEFDVNKLHECLAEVTSSLAFPGENYRLVKGPRPWELKEVLQLIIFVAGPLGRQEREELEWIETQIARRSSYRNSDFYTSIYSSEDLEEIFGRRGPDDDFEGFELVAYWDDLEVTEDGDSTTIIMRIVDVGLERA